MLALLAGLLLFELRRNKGYRNEDENGANRKYAKPDAITLAELSSAFFTQKILVNVFLLINYFLNIRLGLSLKKRIYSASKRNR